MAASARGAANPDAGNLGVHEAVVPLREPLTSLTVVTHIRSTLLVSSLSTIKEAGLLDRYNNHLAPAQRAEMAGLLAGAWVRAELAEAHYLACEGLGISPAQQFELGRAVGLKIDKTIASTVLSAAKQMGATPWVFLSQVGRLYPRLVMGGAIACYRLADKEAVLEHHKSPLFRIAYLRNAYRGAIQAICERFCTKAYVKPRDASEDGMRITFRVSWA
jgi:hypothetical protein